LFSHHNLPGPREDMTNAEIFKKTAERAARMRD
jgi:hypothetical protein